MMARTLSDARKRWNLIVGARIRRHLCVFKKAAAAVGPPPRRCVKRDR